MRTFTAVLVLGLLSQQALCQLQMNPALMAAMMSGGQGGAGLAGMGMAGLAGMGGLGGAEMNDLLMMQALSGGNRGGQGGSGGSGGGIDPAMLMMLSGAGGAMGGGGGGNADLMTTMMMMDAMSGGNQGGAGGQGQGQVQGQSPAGAGGFGGSLANMLGNSGSGITPQQQRQLWQFVGMRGLSQRVMDAVQNPVERVGLERDGIIPNADPSLTLAMNAACPRPTQCQFAFCENTEIPFTPESFYMCRGCPRCRLETGQQSMVNMMSQMGGAGGQGMAQMAQQMAMMRALGGGSGGGGGASQNPLMAMALMRQMQARQQAQQHQQQAAAVAQQQQMAPQPMPMPQQRPQPQGGQVTAGQVTVVGGPRPQWTPPAGFPVTGRAGTQPVQGPTPMATSPNMKRVQSSSIPKPPPEFIAMMKKMGQQIRSRGGPTGGSQQVPPSGGSGPKPPGTKASP